LTEAENVNEYAEQGDAYSATTIYRAKPKSKSAPAPKPLPMSVDMVVE
jgi:hypothetical protein